MNAVFADTFFFLALLNDDDPAHERALSEARKDRDTVTSEFIVLELGNACARAEDHSDFIALIKGIRASPRMTVIPLSSDLLTRGIRLMEARSDKNWSLTDCVSFTVMKERGLTDALTADRHFEQAGFKALFLG